MGNLQFLFELIFTGLCVGSVYSLIAHGFNITFWTTKVVNFGHGQFMMFCSMLVLAFLTMGLPWLLAIPLGLIIIIIIGMLLERISVRPLLKFPSSMGWVVSTLGVGLLLEALASRFWGSQAISFPPLIFQPTDYVSVFGTKLSLQYLLVLIVSLFIMVILEFVMNKTIWGKAMKAVAFDPNFSRLMGIKSKKVITLSFMISAFLAGIAGVLISPIYGSISPAFGLNIMILGFVAAVIGGMGNSKGALIGGLSLGVIEKLVGGYISTSAEHGIGAYASAILMMSLELPFILTIVLVGLINALVGYLLSFLVGRVKEFYLGIMTLGFSFILLEIAKGWSSVTGGVMGLNGIPSAQLNTFEFFGIQIGIAYYYWIVLVFVAFFLWLFKNFVQSYYGRSFLAVHRSELSAASIGISPKNVKRLAYTLSALIAGVAGVFYVHLIGYVGPNIFAMMQSVQIIIMGILGGFGTIIGPILGAGFIAFVPNKLQFIQEFELMIYALLLIVSFLIIPKGFAGILNLRTTMYKISKGKNSSSQSKRIPQKVFEAKEINPTHPPILKTEEIVKDFSGVRALNSISIEIYPGEVLGLLGPNGSGKSTLVNLITGIYPITSGTIAFKNEYIQNISTDNIAKKGLIRTFQDPHNVPNMTVRENILLGNHRLFKSNIVSCVLNTNNSLNEEKEMLMKVDKIIELSKLTDYSDEEAGNLPYGTQRIIEVSRAILAEPQILMLDEPAAGLSETELEILVGLIRYVKEKGVSVVLIDHHMDFVSRLVDRVVVLDSGEQIYTGDMSGMKHNQKVIEAYLGVSTHD